MGFLISRPLSCFLSLLGLAAWFRNKYIHIWQTSIQRLRLSKFCPALMLEDRHWVEKSVNRNLVCCVGRILLFIIVVCSYGSCKDHDWRQSEFFKESENYWLGFLIKFCVTHSSISFIVKDNYAHSYLGFVHTWIVLNCTLLLLNEYSHMVQKLKCCLKCALSSLASTLSLSSFPTTNFSRWPLYLCNLPML